MKNDAVLVRAAAAGDMERLQAIRAAAFAPVFASFRRLLGEDIAAFALAGAEREQADLLRRLCEQGGDARVFVAERNGQPIGFVALTLNPGQGLGEIVLIAVAQSEANRGVGETLLAHALEAMRAAGLVVAYVGAGADESHQPALRAYEKAGFGASIQSRHMYRML